MQFHQLLVSASPGDAITHAACELRRILRQVGPSEIFARYYDPALAGDVRPLSHYEQTVTGPDGILLFHASIGDPDVLAFIDERTEPMVLIYHNISPASAFRPYDPTFAELLESGRTALSKLNTRVAAAIAVSQFNAADLAALGYSDVRVCPLIVDLTRLHSTRPDAPTVHHLTTEIEGPVILYVGQLLPHKRPDVLVKAFHVLVTYLVPGAHLILVGASRVARYRDVLQLFMQELALDQAWLAGAVTQEELVAFYQRADLFATASEHEGFCVPLLEAMSFDLPVVARAHGAIPETLGDAGLLLPPEEDPALFAEAMATVLTTPAVRDELVSAGQRRLHCYEPERSRATFLEQLLDIF